MVSFKGEGERIEEWEWEKGRKRASVDHILLLLPLNDLLQLLAVGVGEGGEVHWGGGGGAAEVHGWEVTAQGSGECLRGWRRLELMMGL